MVEVAEFKALSKEFLDRCTKEQLLKIVNNYEVEISDKRLKDTVKGPVVVYTDHNPLTFISSLKCPNQR